MVPVQTVPRVRRMKARAKKYDIQTPGGAGGAGGSPRTAPASISRRGEFCVAFVDS